MRQNFTYSFSWILIIALAISINYAFAFSPQTVIKPDTLSYYLGAKKPKKKSLLSLAFPPIKPGVISTTKVNIVQPGDKLLSNVEVYPNPATDQINIKYSVSRNSTVNIKLKDILGNNVATLSSKNVEAGEYTFPCSIKNNNIAKGFYFIHVVAGGETVIRRISIL